jgi:hypothetical protein
MVSGNAMDWASPYPKSEAKPFSILPRRPRVRDASERTPPSSRSVWACSPSILRPATKCGLCGRPPSRRRDIGCCDGGNAGLPSPVALWAGSEAETVLHHSPCANTAASAKRLRQNAEPEFDQRQPARRAVLY